MEKTRTTVPGTDGGIPRHAPDGLALSVVIPTYGRAASLFETIRLLDAFLADWPGVAGAYEIILVDDASQDGTDAVVRKICAALPCVHGVLLAGNRGQQNATLAGLRVARGAWVVTMDDDRKNDPRDIPRLLAELAAGYDVVYGVPQTPEGPRLHRRLGTVVKEWVLAGVCRKPADIRLTSFRAMRAETVRRAAAETRRHVYLSATLLQEPIRIGQVPVRDTVDAVSASGYHFWKLAAQLWHIVVEYGRGPIARIFRRKGEPCPVKELVP
jgi:undecaprenyl-phosphate 4-deoxy-4-formamido-L-arabinose transferase